MQATLGRIPRRLVTIPGYFLAWGLAVLLLPLLLVAGLAFDAGSGRKWARTRLLLFLVAYLSLDLVGLTVSFALWLRHRVIGRSSHAQFLRAHLPLKRFWAGKLVACAFRIFGMKLEVEGAECAEEGPLLIFIRHASMADTLIPICIFPSLEVRFVMKKELLWEPCLDVVGHRLPNVFIDRAATDPRPEINAIAGLARSLADDEGVLIYPEGTRFTPEKKERVLAALTRRGETETVERARALRHLLPPRPGGALALVEAVPDVDVLFVAHTGLEGLATVRDVWNGTVVGRTVRFGAWRIKAADIPQTRAERVRWLQDQWARVDDWVDAAIARDV